MQRRAVISHGPFRKIFVRIGTRLTYIRPKDAEKVVIRAIAIIGILLSVGIHGPAQSRSAPEEAAETFFKSIAVEDSNLAFENFSSEVSLIYDKGDLKPDKAILLKRFSELRKSGYEFLKPMSTEIDSEKAVVFAQFVGLGFHSADIQIFKIELVKRDKWRVVGWECFTCSIHPENQLQRPPRVPVGFPRVKPCPKCS